MNLYVPSTLHWQERELTVERTTDYPADPSGEVLIKITGRAKAGTR